DSLACRAPPCTGARAPGWWARRLADNPRPIAAADRPVFPWRAGRGMVPAVPVRHPEYRNGSQAPRVAADLRRPLAALRRRQAATAGQRARVGDPELQEGLQRRGGPQAEPVEPRIRCRRAGGPAAEGRLERMT